MAALATNQTASGVSGATAAWAGGIGTFSAWRSSAATGSQKGPNSRVAVILEYKTTAMAEFEIAGDCILAAEGGINFQLPACTVRSRISASDDANSPGYVPFNISSEVA